MIKSFCDEYAFLSNFFEAPFEIEGLRYKTVEHYYQAQKTDDPVERSYIRNLPTPKEAKARGYKVQLRGEWEWVKLDVMRRAVKAKFEQNPALKKRLLATKNEQLQETNTWGDEYWGVDSKTGAGLNWLGRILMEVRAQLKERK